MLKVVTHDAAADELKFVVINVGSAELDASTLPNASCRLTTPEGAAFDMQLVGYKAEAWLPAELSGDHSESHFEIAAH